MNIKINISSYILVLLSFLAGYFDIVFLTLISIIIHELGHYLSAIILKMKVKEIEIYFFGGVTKIEEDLNSSILKEVIMLLSGPLLEVLFVIIVFYLNKQGLVTNITYSKLLRINTLLLKINLLPIIPLDGGRLINNILDLILPYKKSNIISIIISFISLPMIFILTNKLISLYLLIFIIIKLIDEIKNVDNKLNKLIIERKINNYNFKKTIKINRIEEIKRNKNYILK